MWGISALFSGGENQSSAREDPRGHAHREPTYTIEHALSTIHLQEPPTILRASETPSEQEAIEIAATKLLLSAYFNIVRKIIENSVPKAIMHFLVNNTKQRIYSKRCCSYLERWQSRESAHGRLFKFFNRLSRHWMNCHLKPRVSKGDTAGELTPLGCQGLMAFLLRPPMHQACSLDVCNGDLVEWFPRDLGLLLILKRAAELEQNMQGR